MIRVRRTFAIVGVVAIISTLSIVELHHRRTHHPTNSRVFARQPTERCGPGTGPLSSSGAGDDEVRSSNKPDGALEPSTPAEASTQIPRNPDESLDALVAEVKAAAQIADPNLRQEALVRACLKWAETDPKSALSLARQLQVDQGEGDVMGEIVQQWSSHDAAAALAWIETNSQSDERDRLLGRAVFSLAQTQPENAARFVVRDMRPGAAQDEAALTVLNQWAMRDPVAATAWARSFPSELRDRALADLNAVHLQAAAGLGL